MNDKSRFSTLNSILNSLPRADLERLSPQLERVELPSGKVLYRPDGKIDYVYFPDRAMISVVAYTAEGQGSEVAVIGSEGATGLDVVLGVNTTANENITQLPDGAMRMKASDVCAEFARHGKMQELLLQFIRKLMVQMGQTTLCNRLHTTEKRLSRWLLMCHDRAGSDVVNLTQEFMAVMLGSSRATVTLTAIELQNRGFISYTRGVLKITDRAGLAEFTCPCYKIIRKAYDRK